MEVKEVRYSKKFNAGNYESEEYGLVAVLDESEDAEKSMYQLKKMVADLWAKKGTVPDTGTTKKAKEVVEEDDEEISEEVSDTELSDDENENHDEAGGQKKVAKDPGKKFKKKGSVYSRSNENHKMLFTELLNEQFPNWRDAAKSKSRAKDASIDLEGTEFLDADGEIVPSFIKELKKLMK